MLKSLQTDINLVLNRCSSLIDTYNLGELKDFIYNNSDLFINDWATVAAKKSCNRLIWWAMEVGRLVNEKR